MDLKQKAKELPVNSGVYIMNNQAGEIIYVGKARNLKNRVKSYFQDAKNQTEKVRKLMQNVTDFRYIITNNEIEALLLENTLIKKYTPKYNILLKDDKQYPFIKIDLSEQYPKLTVVRNIKNDNARYFGPYMQGVSASEIINLVSDIIPLRSCNLNFNKIPINHRPGLNYHINKCLAPCINNITKEEYDELVKEVIAFLRGDDQKFKKKLIEKMEYFAKNEQFEIALMYRDKLKVFEKIERKQVTYLKQDYNLDIFSVSSNKLYACVSYLVVRAGKLVGEKDIPLRAETLSNSEILEEFLSQFYEDKPIVADEVVINIELENKDIIAQYLRNKAGKIIDIVVPQKGVKKQLIDMAETNSIDYLVNQKLKLENEFGRTVGAVEELKALLNLSVLPKKIECYDISNISGTDKVSSMVVFVNGKSQNSLYRRFKIKTVEGANDFMCMKETLYRRLKKSFDSADESFGILPDLILIDGGKGQLKYAKEAMQQLNLSVPMISIAERNEEIYLNENEGPLILPKTSLSLQLLQRVRDEAHRFAITYHRQLRLNRQTKSELINIEGIGEKKIELLYKHFKSLKKIKEASKEELASVKGINKNDANNIYNYFNNL